MGNHRFKDHDLNYLKDIDKSTIQIIHSPTDKILKKYLKKTDALIFPSYYEGWGLPVYEGLAQGCNIIFSNIPPVKSFIKVSDFSFDPSTYPMILYNIIC